ncbi:MAG: mevalonate kinase [Polyangiales bacterium]
MKPSGASAPGKALLCGEYAVLDGAPALIAAVDRRVRVTWTEGSLPMTAEVHATLALAQAAVGEVEGSLRLDARDLHQDEIKLGLGSSAAAAAATAGAVFAANGYAIEERQTRQQVFECAFEGHASIAPQGSGADVAASVFGGFLRFERTAERVSTRAVSRPEGLEIRLVWTGHAARTSDLVGRVKTLERDDPKRYRDCMSRLAELAAAFSEAFEAGDADALVARAGEYGAAMGSLGDAAGAPIVEERLELASNLALRYSGRAKPCGAGGGDVAIAFFGDPDAARRFELACKDEELHPIDVSWGAKGVQAR